MVSSTCTTLDHIYPRTIAGTPCYCGDRTWAGAPKRALVLKVGVRVRVLEVERVVVAKERGEDVYRVNEPVKGRALFERDELQVIA